MTLQLLSMAKTADGRVYHRRDSCNKIVLKAFGVYDKEKKIVSNFKKC